MKLLRMLTDNWWGILIIVAVACMALFVLSALLYRQFFKRFYDVLLSGMAILVLSPVLLVLIVVGAIKMKGNPFFVQLRPGRRKRLSRRECRKRGVPYGTYGEEKIFKLIKFRTMTCEKDEFGNLLPDEKRLTKYGRVLRSTSLDELPELFNVFVGHMSVVGPRPMLVRDMVFMSDDVRMRHAVRSGVTGLAQVSGRNNITWEQKFEYDIKYVNKISLFGDISILFKTVLKVLKRSDIEREGTVSDIDYGDWLKENGTVTEEEYDLKQAEAKRICAKILGEEPYVVAETQISDVVVDENVEQASEENE